MKSYLFVCLFFLSNIAFSQTSLFETEISAEQLSVDQKLTPEHAKDYIFTKYYFQPAFALGQDLVINLPVQRTITAIFDKKFVYSNGAESFVYKVQGETMSELVLSKFGDAISGMYASEYGEKIMFNKVAPQYFAVSIYDEASIILQDSKDDTVLLNSPLSKFVNADICNAANTCPATTIDVMIVYTTDAMTQWGGMAASNAQCATIVTNFNNALSNSGATGITINLVHSAEILYTESGSISTDLSRFRTQNDGFLDDVHLWRDTYGADVCALLTATPTNTCGLGYLNSNSTNYNDTSAFSVTIRGCAVGNYSTSHEMGHNMGLNHDWYVSTNTNPCSHHHGYVNQNAITQGTASPSSIRWRTIMSYNDQCSDSFISCTRTNRWSNPNVNYNGDPTGVDLTAAEPAYEIYGFQRFACVVSDFRPTVSLSTNENNLKNDEIFIYPNPVKETLMVEAPNENKYLFEIVNAVGQKIKTSSARKISVNDLATGIYFLKIYQDDKTFVGTRKFIVEK